MSNAATPKRLSLKRASEQNGVVTNYTFHVQSASKLSHKDEIHITMPVPVYFSPDTACISLSSNLIES